MNLQTAVCVDCILLTAHGPPAAVRLLAMLHAQTMPDIQLEPCTGALKTTVLLSENALHKCIPWCSECKLGEAGTCEEGRHVMRVS